MLVRSPIGVDASTCRFCIKRTFTSAGFSRHYALLDELPGRLDTRTHPNLAAAWDEVRLYDRQGGGQFRVVMRDGHAISLRFALFSNTYDLFLLLSEPASGL